MARVASIITAFGWYVPGRRARARVPVVRRAGRRVGMRRPAGRQRLAPPAAAAAAAVRRSAPPGPRARARSARARSALARSALARSARLPAARRRRSRWPRRARACSCRAARRPCRAVGRPFLQCCAFSQPQFRLDGPRRATRRATSNEPNEGVLAPQRRRGRAGCSAARRSAEQSAAPSMLRKCTGGAMPGPARDDC